MRNTSERKEVTVQWCEYVMCPSSRAEGVDGLFTGQVKIYCARVFWPELGFHIATAVLLQSSIM
jgi:hypothetical protein